MRAGRWDKGWRWHVLAAVVFGAALALRYSALIGADLARFALVPDQGHGTTGPGGLPAADLRFVIWLVARNAFTLLHAPWRIFQAEPCHPAADALALGEPGLTLGLLGTPAWLLFRDPLIAFHCVQLASVWIGAFAMYLLVGAWTGRPAAGLTAGLLFGFHPLKTTDVIHPYVPDIAWTVLALYFAERLFAKGRWRDAAGLAACVLLQLGGSLYPLAGAAVLALPCLAWLLLRHGLRGLRAGPLLLAVGLPLLAAAVLFAPFLALHGEGVLRHRIHLYMPWADLLPGGPLFPGWLFLALAALGCALPVRDGRPDPRWALLAGWILATLLASGGNTGDAFAALASGKELPPLLPNPYAALAGLIPGLDVVRAPRNLYVASHLALAVLAGLGAAALLRRVPVRFAGATALALVAAAGLEVLGPRLPGLAPRPPFVLLRVAPDAERLALFERLAELGNRGPVFHAPFNPANLRMQSENVLLSAYHHRRTNACYGSFRPAETEAMQQLGAELPGPDGVRGLAELGFTTVVLRAGPEPLLEATRARFERAAAAGGPALVAASESDSAWSLAGSVPSEPPNIVLVISDDQGWPDFGFMGSEQVRTPNLDRLAEEGVTFSQGFDTGSSCRPSLLSLATGLHPVQLRARSGRSGRIELPRSLIEGFATLPGILSQRGYATFQGGKWWEGGFERGGFTHGMTLGPRKPPGSLDGGDVGLALGRDTMEPLWSFLEQHRDVPFFVWFAPMLPHAPFDAPDEYSEPYREAGAAAPYFANIARFDARVGELLERLDALGLREKTLVVFLSDNGWDVHTPRSIDHPLLMDGPHGKSSIRELGFRTPVIFRWPGVLPAGVRDEHLVSTVDLLPTLLDFASAPVPPGLPGQSLRPLLTGRDGTARDFAFGGMLQLRNDDPAAGPPFLRSEAWFVRTPQWRLVWYPERGASELYRIDRDPFEEHDVAAEHPRVAEFLRARLEAWLRQARRPQGGSDAGPGPPPATSPR